MAITEESFIPVEGIIKAGKWYIDYCREQIQHLLSLKWNDDNFDIPT